VLFEKSNAGYAAHVPDLPTILVTGKTLEETKQRAMEAIGIYKEEMQALGISLPEPAVIADYLTCRGAS
jgi:predicted RNase H-like HicB family nuclease